MTKIVRHPDRFNARQVGFFCAVSDTTVKKWDREGLLKFKRVPDSNHRYIEGVELYAFMILHEVPIPPELEKYAPTPLEPEVVMSQTNPADSDEKELVTQEVADKVCDKFIERLSDKELVTQEVKECDEEECDHDHECDDECHG